jgi:hypothetical protein
METYALAPTVANQGLASAVNRRIHSDAVMLSAKAFALRVGGLGLGLLLFGAGVGAAFYGYSYAVDSRTSAQQMAAALADALKHVSMGHVTLDVPNQKIGLAVPPDASVKLDTSGRTVTLVVPSGASVGASPLPFQNVPPVVQTPSARVVTNYTIFHSVEFAGGAVETGWRYTSSDQTTPTSQYCLYRAASSDGTDRVVSVGRDRVPSNAVGLAPPGAFGQCIWFNG